MTITLDQNNQMSALEVNKGRKSQNKTRPKEKEQTHPTLRTTRGSISIVVWSTSLSTRFPVRAQAFLFVCVLYVCVCVHVFVGMCVEVRGRLWVSLSVTLHIFLTNPELSVSTRLTVSELQGSFCLCLPGVANAYTYKRVPRCPCFLHGFWE